MYVNRIYFEYLRWAPNNLTLKTHWILEFGILEHNCQRNYPIFNIYKYQHLAPGSGTIHVGRQYIIKYGHLKNSN